MRPSSVPKRHRSYVDNLNKRCYHSRWDWLSLLYIPQASLGAVGLRCCVESTETATHDCRHGLRIFTAVFSSFSAGLPLSTRPRTVSFFDTLLDPPNENQR
ncbi:uncharacterized protein SCHCODRAFT_02306185 [Schizophyllum commune H4-8]|uniref:Expressed protein n=1 Tax=Schizophyllum commune (strain H4-8 / FGSC 9210) TaxID=578458 RepID=D8Q6I3_SCHCM|nr:uncharacterized protein SCHCODRAFT_02306185 [Schizophyllum commune H4-8]KAI5890931.1 hypothetical protein SCHCODRAFT_02306185 [Schizophyllum commune H4-8]